jgi:hypothetical protein
MIHEITPVNMNTLPLKVSRTTSEALITKDRMRVDVEAEFYVRVQPERRAVGMAASTLGRRTLEPESLHALLAGKFENACGCRDGHERNAQNHDLRRARAPGGGSRLSQRSRTPDPSPFSTSIRQPRVLQPSNRFDAEVSPFSSRTSRPPQAAQRYQQDATIQIVPSLEAEGRRWRSTAQERPVSSRNATSSSAGSSAHCWRRCAERETQAESAQISARGHRARAHSEQRGIAGADRLGCRNPPARGARTQTVS